MVNLVYDLAQAIDLSMTFTICETHGLLISSQEKLVAGLVNNKKYEQAGAVICRLAVYYIGAHECHDTDGVHVYIL